MISEALIYAVDLAADTTHQAIKQPLVRGDKKAHTITLKVTDNGTAATLTNCTASVVVVRADGATITCASTISGNTITAAIQNACYLYAGETNFYCRLSSSDGVYTRTLLWLTGTVVTADTDTIVTDTTTTLPSIDEFNAVLTQCQTAASTAESAATAVGNYPYTQVQGYANAAKSSADAAQASARAASAASGIPPGGSEGQVLMVGQQGAIWSSSIGDRINDVEQQIASAGHTFTTKYVDFACSGVNAQRTLRDKTVTVTCAENATIIPLAGIPTYTFTGAVTMICTRAVVDGTVGTIYYDMVSGYGAATSAGGIWRIYYIEIN